MSEVIREKLDMKREMVITNVEIREEVANIANDVTAPVAVSFLNKHDKESILKRSEAVEKAGLKVIL